jgi:hypothetical protein
MRNIDKLLLLPLFATLAISCSSPTSLQTSEYDDVYYSKKDKTIIQDNAPLAAASSAETPAAADDAGAANPEYSRQSSGASAVDNGTDYYSPGYDEDDYYYASRIRRFNAPYRGLSYYDFAYTDYYWYNRNPLYYGRSIYSDPFYAYSNPFYPCYTCYGYPPIYGGVNIVIGQPYYNRWGWGNPYYGGYNRGLYGGYGYGGYGGRFANNSWYRNDNNSSRNVQYGPRRDRSAVPGGNDRDNTPNRPRREIGSGGVSGGGGMMQPGDGNLRTTRSTRGRAADNSNGGNDAMTQPEETRTGTRGRIDRSTETLPADRPLEPTNTRRSSRGRAEQLESAPMPGEQRVIQPRTTEEAPASPRGRDRRFEPRSSEGQPVYQPRQEQRSEPTYQPRPQRQEQRSEPTQRSQPTYQAPQRQERSYSPPSSPTYNTPSRSSGGGGSDGGSGGGRSSRGRGN